MMHVDRIDGPSIGELVDADAFRARRPPRRRPGDELRTVAALRRLAAVVARDASPCEIFRAVADEIGRFLGADGAAVARFEPGHSGTIVAGYGRWVHEPGVAGRVELDDVLGMATVASPITVEGRPWGVAVVSLAREPLPADAEERMARFTELLGVVVAGAVSRAELYASRAREVAAGDEARRRVTRDLHDGAQARMVSTVIALKLARRELGDTTGPAVELIEEAIAHAEGARDGLRELAHGTLPGALIRGGLRAGIDALVSRLHLRVSVDVTAERLPEELEAAAYFMVAEALTNAARHARAGNVQIAAVVDGDALRLVVRDDGVGGARTGEGSGLVGLQHRAAALNGRLCIDSPPGEGTTIAATLPIATSNP